MLQSSYEGGGSVRHPSDALDADIDDVSERSHESDLNLLLLLRLRKYCRGRSHNSYHQCLSFDVAERLREQTQANHLDEDELGCLEEDIRLLGIAVRSATPEVYFSAVQ
jgi:hypothetical protein